ncbi:MAG: hypothetical protein HQL99_17380 [Magnetococcales bacterium]|nr:hypothetical protein [Magnetococcales bacterium]
MKVLFDDIRQHLKRSDREQMPHPIIPILLKLGVKKQTVTNYLVERNLLCRASGFNLMNGAISKVSKEIEGQLLDILKLSLQQAILISKNYRKFHQLRSVEHLNTWILNGKRYLETLNEPMVIDFHGIGDVKEIDGIQEDIWIKYIDYV